MNTKCSATAEKMIESELMMAERFSTCGGRRYSGGGNRCRQPLDAAAALHDSSGALCASREKHYREAWLNHVLVLSERTGPGGDDEPPSCPSPDGYRRKRISVHVLLGVKRVARSVGLFRKYFTTWPRGRKPFCGDQQQPAVQSPPRTDVKPQQCNILDMRMELRHAKSGESLMLGLCSVNFAASPAVTTVDLLDFDTNSIKDSLSEDGRQSADAPSLSSTADMATLSTVLPLPLSLFSFTPSASSCEEQRSRAPSNGKASTWKARNLRNDLSWLYGPCSGVRNTPSFSPARPWTATTAANPPVASSGSHGPRCASSMPAHCGALAPPPWEADVSRSVDEESLATRCARSGHGHSNDTSPGGGHGLPASSFLAFLQEWHGPVHEVELLDTECGTEGEGRRPNDVSGWSRVRIELSPMSRHTV
ncbi:hypothetical protein VaNZ11_012112 [Volvox africanus]|uniref:Uncharacterized protein n=1 Tax=Volvox africanus TaxID=51714 RepID=A0ABQ5SD44_9CHLO|nr:hypothetical protein VaNZ11_012112 [Volvox africanus]